jgi:hypothetical protein
MVLLQDDTPPWLRDSIAWTFSLSLLIATWGTFMFLMLYTSHTLYGYAVAGQDAPDDDDVYMPKLLKIVAKLPRALRFSFGAVSASTFLAGLTIFGAIGVKLSFAALRESPEQWVQEILSDTMIGCLLVSLWGSGLFLAGYGTHQVWTFVLDQQTVFRTKKQPTLSDPAPNELKVSFVEQWPASMQAVFYFVVLGAYFSCLAFMGSVGLYASHWAFNKTQPDWLSELVLQTLVNAVLVVLWGTVLLFVMLIVHKFDQHVAWGTHSRKLKEKTVFHRLPATLKVLHYVAAASLLLALVTIIACGAIGVSKSLHGHTSQGLPDLIVSMLHIELLVAMWSVLCLAFGCLFLFGRDFVRPVAQSTDDASRVFFGSFATEALAKTPALARGLFYITATSLYVSGVFFFAILGIYASHIAFNNTDPEWMTDGIGFVFKVFVTSGVWGGFLFGVVMFVNLVIREFKRAPGAALPGTQQPKKMIVFPGDDVSSLPFQLQFSFFLTAFSLSMSVFAFFAAGGLYLSHLAFHGSTPAWMGQFVYYAFLVSLLTAFWGAIFFFAFLLVHQLQCYFAEQTQPTETSLTKSAGKQAKIKEAQLIVLALVACGVCFAMFALLFIAGVMASKAAFDLDPHVFGNLPFNLFIFGLSTTCIGLVFWLALFMVGYMLRTIAHTEELHDRNADGMASEHRDHGYSSGCPAVSPQPAQMAVTLPPGVQAGQSLQINTPDGRVLTVITPPGVAPGGQFLVDIGVETA